MQDRISLLSVGVYYVLQNGLDYSSCRKTSSNLGLCLVERPVRGSVESTREGLGWPTRSRALALTALVAENLSSLRFVMAKMSME
jgi:hypothetical protein